MPLYGRNVDESYDAPLARAQGDKHLAKVIAKMKVEYEGKNPARSSTGRELQAARAKMTTRRANMIRALKG